MIVEARRQLVLGAQLTAFAGLSVRRQARPDELLVWCLQSREVPIDAIQEARLVEAAGGRQDREGGPLDAIRQGLLGEVWLAQPPQRSIRLTQPHQVGMVVPP